MARTDRGAVVPGRENGAGGSAALTHSSSLSSTSHARTPTRMAMAPPARLSVACVIFGGSSGGFASGNPERVGRQPSLCKQ